MLQGALPVSHSLIIRPTLEQRGLRTNGRLWVGPYITVHLRYSYSACHMGPQGPRPHGALTSWNSMKPHARLDAAKHIGKCSFR